ncbi:MAG: hypothetical protein KDA47_08650 [Planctomycetales bacterium]|nr:hypothetical protein [Planctomycetales bacterium]
MPDSTGVVQIRHEVWRTGIYHRRLSRFVLLHDGGNQKVFPTSRSLSDLPDSMLSPHGFPLQEAEKDGWFAKTYRFTFLAQAFMSSTSSGILRREEAQSDNFPSRAIL